MITTLEQIISKIKAGKTLDAKSLDAIVRKRNREMHDARRTVAKKRLMSRYLKEYCEMSDIWKSWEIDEDTHRRIIATLRAKPRRTASGVATITVLTKPWSCSSDCIYCPNDIRMPKSYMSDEPACQRAERNFFDPYLQIVSRLSVLEDMGHVIDKVELIVLGGTWSDYPDSYRLWFTKEMFRALNDFDLKDPDGALGRTSEVSRIRDLYGSVGLTSDPICLERDVHNIQSKIDNKELSYNEALYFLRSTSERYGANFARDDANASEDELTHQLELEQTSNENAAHRVVGLVFETRPDRIDEDELIFLRRLGATKIQMGIQSLDNRILALNTRSIDTDQIACAMDLIRLYGFKTHIHLMVNLVGSTPEEDIEQYRRLVTEDAFKPDEVKLYPCALVQSSGLTELFEDGRWKPYSEEELLHILASDIIMTPAYTRISRMIRDISAKDILVGNKKTNLRQMVEERACTMSNSIDEMRMREVSTDDIDQEDLTMEYIHYHTASTEEVFIQYVTSANRLVAFLRLSLPNKIAIASLDNPDIISPTLSSAMIREVHVYGKVSKLHEANEGTQHIGLGRSMIDQACTIAKSRGFDELNVISSVGTRQYYRHLGFTDRGLYQTRFI